MCGYGTSTTRGVSLHVVCRQAWVLVSPTCSTSRSRRSAAVCPASFARAAAAAPGGSRDRPDGLSTSSPAMNIHTNVQHGCRQHAAVQSRVAQVDVLHTCIVVAACRPLCMHIHPGWHCGASDSLTLCCRLRCPGLCCSTSHSWPSLTSRCHNDIGYVLGIRSAAARGSSCKTLRPHVPGPNKHKRQQKGQQHASQHPCVGARAPSCYPDSEGGGGGGGTHPGGHSEGSAHCRMSLSRSDGKAVVRDGAGASLPLPSCERPPMTGWAARRPPPPSAIRLQLLPPPPVSPSPEPEDSTLLSLPALPYTPALRPCITGLAVAVSAT